jgi:hypothetical protein
MRHQRARVRWVYQYPETAWRPWRPWLLLGDVVRPLDRWLGGEQPDLAGVLFEPGAEDEPGVVAVVPVPVPVVRDPELGPLVVTLAEPPDELLVRWLARALASSMAWCASRRILMTSSAQDWRLPGPSGATARQRRMMCWQHCCTPAS